MTETNGPRLVASLWSLVVVSLAFLAGRLICKARYSNGFAWDDHILIFSWICFLVYAALATVSTTYGYGHHLLDISPADIPMAIKLLYIGQLIAGLGAATSKASFALTLLRIAQKPWQIFLLWFFGLSSIFAHALSIIFTFVACTPVRKVWDPTVPGHCWGFKALLNYGIFMSSYSAAIDFVLSTFPTLIIWKLQMNKKEKVGVVVCMSLGFFAGIVTVGRACFIPRITTKDFTFKSVILSICVAGEIAVTIIATSMPFYRRAVQETLTKSKGYHLDEYNMDNLSKHKSLATANQISKNGFATAASMPDSESERQILGGMNDGNDVRTGELSVSYRNSGDEEGQAEKEGRADPISG